MSRLLKTTLQTLAVCLVVILGAGILYAWTGPTASPPGNNTSAPINTGSNTQTKSGDLTIHGDLTADNNICLGGTCRSTWPSGGGGVTDTNAETECSGTDTYLSGAGICETDQTGGGGTADGYIGNSGLHTAGGTLFMNGHEITGTDGISVDYIGPRHGSGEVEFTTGISVNGRVTANDYIYTNGHITAQGYGWFRDFLTVGGTLRMKGNDITKLDKVSAEGNDVEFTDGISVNKEVTASDFFYTTGHVTAKGYGWIGGNLTVSDDLNVWGNKNFIQSIKGTNKEVVYTSQESGKVRTIWDKANILVEDGSEIIQLPKHFKLVTSNKKPLVVHVTPNNKPVAVATPVKSLKKGIKIKSLSEKDIRVDITVKGIRKGYEDKQIIRQKKDVAN